jgi:hypothetical protein
MVLIHKEWILASDVELDSDGKLDSHDCSTPDLSGR